MLRFFCQPSNQTHRMGRREWLRIGGVFGLDWALLNTGRSAAAGQRVPVDPPAGKARSHPPQAPARPPGFGRARSVILVFCSGGQSQLDTWDPKPDAPEQVRGEFRAVPTAVPGTFVCEHLPQLARLADRYTIVRSMSHEDLDHGSAFYLSMTGHYHNRRSSNPPPAESDYPTHGAVLKRIRPSRDFVQTAVHVNGPAYVPNVLGPGQFGGLLGRDFDPMVIGNVLEERVVVPGLAPVEDVPGPRLSARRSLLETLDRAPRLMEHNRALLDMDGLYGQAYRMLSDPKTRGAFDLQAEPTRLRERYGMNRSGQACLLARRLVEAGVPLVTVIWSHNNRGQDLHPEDTDFYGWDTHNDIFEALKVHLLPRFDQGFSALLEDLDERGLLDETLVLCFGEFGRAPLVALEPRFAGSSPGRKHWASVYSVVLAGAGVSRGQVLGASDARGAFPTTEAYGPWDIAATVYAALGIDPAGHYTDFTGRAFPIATGKPIAELYAG